MHVHTDFISGTSTIDESCVAAIEKNLTAIAFTEHVGSKLSYSFEEYMKGIRDARSAFFGLDVFRGCEVKVLNVDGDLNADPSLLKLCYPIVGVFHGFRDVLLGNRYQALVSMLERNQIDIWGHPASFFNVYEPTERELDEIVRLCNLNQIKIERNKKYPVKNPRFCRRMAECQFCFGSDAHHTSEMFTREEILCSDLQFWSRVEAARAL
jgi:histidinol phosphatase-like PHP family hydrolase